MHTNLPINILNLALLRSLAKSLNLCIVRITQVKLVYDAPTFYAGIPLVL